MRKVIVAIVVGVAVAFGSVGYAYGSIHHTRVRHVAIPTRPCKSDDIQFYQCFYDAGVFGNKHGRSFWIVRKRPGTFCIQYLSGLVNSRNSYCYPASWKNNPPAIR